MFCKIYIIIIKTESININKNKFNLRNHNRICNIILKTTLKDGFL